MRRSRPVLKIVLSVTIVCMCFGTIVIVHNRDAKSATIDVHADKTLMQTISKKLYYAEKGLELDNALMQNISKKLHYTEKGLELNPVVKKHVEYLKRSNKMKKDTDILKLETTAKSSVQHRDIVLTGAESGRVQSCAKQGPEDFAKYLKLFFSQGGQKIRRTHNYLNNNSLVVDVGGNVGDDVSYVLNRNNLSIIILEPLQQFSDLLEKRFGTNPKVSVYNIGLGAKAERIMIRAAGSHAEGTSIFSENNKLSATERVTPIYIMNVIDFFTHLGIGAFEVDLLSINCEGCEFELLEMLTATTLVNSFVNIQWQTHPKLAELKDPWMRYCRITALLSRTHRPTYRFNYTWENWRRNDRE